MKNKSRCIFGISAFILLSCRIFLLDRSIGLRCYRCCRCFFRTYRFLHVGSDINHIRTYVKWHSSLKDKRYGFLFANSTDCIRYFADNRGHECIALPFYILGSCHLELFHFLIESLNFLLSTLFDGIGCT